ncbi:MAG: polysaccharide deacetylase family protein [Myxococcaceae bacterium]|nr:MAG: polysaccharide deacetylase family protein [Myxococcaceae bacterium]
MPLLALAALSASAALAGAYVGGAMLPWPGLLESLIPGSVWACQSDSVALPEIVRRIADEGHVVGNHGWQHISLPTLAGRRMSPEIDRCQLVLTALTGTAPRLLRPPYRRRDLRALLAARRRGLTPVIWSSESCDWMVHDDAGRSRQFGRVRRSDIVLLHDGLPQSTAMISALGTLLAPDTPILSSWRSEAAILGWWPPARATHLCLDPSW